MATGERPEWWVGYARRGALERWANLWANQSGQIERISSTPSWLSPPPTERVFDERLEAGNQYKVTFSATVRSSDLRLVIAGLPGDAAPPRPRAHHLPAS